MHGTLVIRGVALLLSSGAAGAINAVAGGGTLVTFPTLIWLGLSSVSANVTSTVGLVPGALGAAWGYRRELRSSRRWLVWLLPSSLVGGGLGALLLVWTPPAFFDAIAPVLVLGATVLFMLQETISRRLRGTWSEQGTPNRWGVAACQLLIAIYGGYFGAGMGILMLAALGLLHLGNIHQSNSLKAFAGATINGVASGLFIVRGLVQWPEAITMAVGAILGGFLAADAARRLGQRTVRMIVIGIGLTSAVILAVQRFL